MYARLVPGHDRGARSPTAFERAYADAPFVRLTGDDAAGDQARGAHQLLRHRLEGRRSDGPRVRRVSVIDNLVKGAAGQAIQNFNVMFGFDQKAGLL